MSKPLVIDLFCGMGGFSEGFLAEGYEAIGFDNEYRPYPGQLVLQDVLTLHGSRFKNATVIVASPPCQAYSYRAMPWKRAKALPPPDNTLFETCFKIQREASEAAGHKIPMVVENVRGAQKWVGRAKWAYGSYMLWGDVPALMPITNGQAVMKEGIAHRSDGSTNFHGYKSSGLNWSDRTKHGQDFTRVAGNQAIKNSGFRFDGSGRSFQSESVDRHIKNTGGSWFAVAHNKSSGHSCNPVSGIKGTWDNSVRGKLRRRDNSARKHASAMIARIPFQLSNWIARCYLPSSQPCDE